MIVTLDTAKAHCRVRHSADDELIEIYIAAAENRVQQFLNRDIEEILASPPDDSPAEPMAAIKAAVLLYVGDMYENRESQVVGTTIVENPAAISLLWPHRKGLGV
jgi:uncharacterized phage protein (predicted DNA packaging)